MRELYYNRLIIMRRHVRGAIPVSLSPALVWVVLLSVGMVVAGWGATMPDTPDKEVVPKKLNAPGTYQSAIEIVPPDMRYVAVAMDRTDFTQANCRVSLTIRAQVDGIWQVITHTPETTGGARGRPVPLTRSLIYVSLPMGATHVQAEVTVSNAAGTFAITLEFLP
jgi:hypothetical protein